MGFVPEQVIFIPIRHRLRVRRAGPCGVRAPGDQIYWDESKESFTDFLALNRAARARALGQGMPLAESSSRLATSWARLGHLRLRPTRSSTTPSRWLKKKSSQSEFATAEWEFPPPTVGLCCLLGRLGVSKRRLGPTQGRLGPTGGDSRGRFGARRAHSLGRVGAREADSLTPLGPSHPGVTRRKGSVGL